MILNCAARKLWRAQTDTPIATICAVMTNEEEESKFPESSKYKSATSKSGSAKFAAVLIMENLLWFVNQAIIQFLVVKVQVWSMERTTQSIAVGIGSYNPKFAKNLTGFR